MVWWCPSGSPSDSPSVQSPSGLRLVSVRFPSGSPSACFPHFSPTSFDILSWNFAHDFVLMYYRSSLSVITLRQFLKELCLFVNIEYRKYSFPQFSPTSFDILSLNFAHDFVLMYYRSSLSVITLRQLLKELCLFVNLDYRKCAVFCSFLLHVLTYWAENLHMTLFKCTTEQVRVLSIFWRSYASLWTYNIGNTQFSTLFSYMLWHIQLKFAHDFVLMYYRASSSVIPLHQFLKELCLFWN